MSYGQTIGNIERHKRIERNSEGFVEVLFYLVYILNSVCETPYGVERR